MDVTDPSSSFLPITHQEIILDLNADVAEWSFSSVSTNRTTANAKERKEISPRHLLAAGTYQLNESTSQREGKLYIYELRGSIGNGGQEAKQDMPGDRVRLEQRCMQEVPGVFDVEWLDSSTLDKNCVGSQHRAVVDHFVAALADGTLRVYQLAEEWSGLVEIASAEAPDGNKHCMALYVTQNFHSSRSGNCETLLATSYSSGQVQIHGLAAAGLSLTSAWHAHELEAWTVGFDANNPDILYSGGDDCSWKCWDIRCRLESTGMARCSSMIWADRKSHGAGVCCISSSLLQPNVLCTGSYDDIARLWDVRYPAKPLLSADVNTGGGVWRLKWHPTDPELILAACMYNGFAIFRANGASHTFERVESYPYQQGLAYGAGWCHCVDEDGTSLVATCSFYDKLLHLWSPGTQARGS